MMPRVVIRTAASNSWGYANSGIGMETWMTVPWLPPAACAPTIKPNPLGNANIEFRLGLPESGGDGVVWYQAIPFHCRIVAESPTAKAPCGLVCATESRFAEIPDATAVHVKPS